MTNCGDTNLTGYEKHQNFNPILKYCHSLRYKAALTIFSQIAEGNKQLEVLEIGCAHARLFELLDSSFKIKYTGIEICSEFVEVAKQRYGHRPNFSIIERSVLDLLDDIQAQHFDVIICLETLEHIPEREVVRIVEAIAKIAAKRFIFSVPVEIGPIVWLKNFGSWIMRYQRYEQYTLAETFWAGLYQLDKLPPHGIHHKGFDWRWLAQTIRHNMNIVKIRRLPTQMLPSGLSTSILIEAVSRN
jgi:SAM-dependent methyltransferase